MTDGKLHDAIIIGGGPVGCRVAAGLALAGYDVVVLEQKSSLEEPVCCTGLISYECLERFDFDHDLVLNSFNGASVVSPNGRSLKLKHDEIQAYAMARPALDQELYRVAVNSGAAYLFSHQVVGLRFAEDGVSVDVKSGAGTETLRARAAVLASGFSYKLPSGLKIKRGTDWAMGVQIEVEAPDVDNIEVYAGRGVAPGFFAWLVPTGGGRGLVGLISRRNTKRHLDGFVKRLGRSHNITPAAAQPEFRGLTLSPPSRTYGNRLLLVGDVAGQVKTLTGGGLYFGLLGADMAVKHLSAALREDDLSARRLSAYEDEWGGLLGRVLNLGRYARRAFGLLSDGHINYLFNLARRRKLAEKLSGRGDIGFDWHGDAISAAWRLINPFNLKGAARGNSDSNR
jgi:geranylgeranyl reductase family protein